MSGRGDDPYIRRRLYNVLENPDRDGTVARRIDLALIVLISLNVLAVALETVASIRSAHPVHFRLFNAFSVMVFTVEYVARLWVAPENKRYRHYRWPRLRHAVTPLALIDLLAILPFYLSAIVGVDLRFLRVWRLLRVFKLTRYSSAMGILLEVLREQASAFFAGFFILLVLLVLAASGAQLVEQHAQPEKFGSIPASMWWALVTLTTVGYGDVTPITPLGKVFGGLVTVIGVGMAALPAGIIASGLAHHLHQRRTELNLKYKMALQDGHFDDMDSAEFEALRRKLRISRVVAQSIRNEVALHRYDKTCTCPKCGHEFIAPRTIRRE